MSEAELYKVVIMIMKHVRPDGDLSAFSHKEVNYIHELLSKIRAESEDKE